MSVDSRLKRQSATCMLSPFMLSGVYGSTTGITNIERASVVWAYGGTPFGSICWGHATAVTQENFRAFTVNWSGTGSIAGEGDSERILLSSGKTLTSEIWKVQGDVELVLNQYGSGSTPDTIEYRTGITMMLVMQPRGIHIQ